jgi:hypothetical protein
VGCGGFASTERKEINDESTKGSHTLLPTYYVVPCLLLRAAVLGQPSSSLVRHVCLVASLQHLLTLEGIPSNDPSPPPFFFSPQFYLSCTGSQYRNRVLGCEAG